MEKPYWEGKEYSYFSHKKCEFFPCHKNADPDDFNCGGGACKFLKTLI